jgi:hypothetical protein
MEPPPETSKATNGVRGLFSARLPSLNLRPKSFLNNSELVSYGEPQDRERDRMERERERTEREREKIERERAKIERKRIEEENKKAKKQQAKLQAKSSTQQNPAHLVSGRPILLEHNGVDQGKLHPGRVSEVDALNLEALDLHRKIREVEREKDHAVEELRKERASASEELRKQIANALEKTEKLESLKQQHEIHNTALTNKLGKEKAENERYKAELQELQKYVWPLQKKLSQKYNADIDSNGRHPTRILLHCARQFADLESEKNRRELEYQKEIADAKSAHSRQLANVASTHNRQMADVKSACSREISDMRNEHARIMKDIDGVHKQAVDEMVHSHEQSTMELEVVHAAKVEKLEAEIARLEKGLVTNVDRFQPLPDTTFKSRFTNLKKKVSDLAYLFPQDFDANAVCKAFRQTGFVHAAEFVQIAPKKYWRHLLEGTLWNILMHGLFTSPFSVFGPLGEEYLDMWQDLFQKRELILPFSKKQTKN